MNKIKALFLVMLGLLFVACGDGDPFSIENTEVTSSVDRDHNGLIRINAENSFVVMGTSDENARYYERPRMMVRFTYDFSIGKHEVTYGEFYKYATKDGWGAFSKSVLDNWPITDVTYFDAILFANERSKAEGFDTAYTYESKGLTAEGHCGKLDGLVFRPEVDAYRLPTEAEWMLVARQGWNLKEAWTVENASGVIHQVCTIGENDVGVCDMAGNALEWVNDWMVGFKDTIVYNFAGAADGGFSGERIVKGGHFGVSSAFVNPASRGDVYSVTSSTRAIYVGFRLAFGHIPDPLWFNSRGNVSEERFMPKISGSKMRSLTGSGNNKLVFRNDVSGNLAYVDYGSAPQTVIEIQDTLDCYHPDISPNGTLVAFSTGMEGVTANSSVYVRRLNLDGDSLVKLDVENAAIPRWYVTALRDTTIIYVTNAGDNSGESEFKSYSTWQVPFMKGKFGKPVKLFDGAYHGGVSRDEHLAVTGSRLLRARIDQDERALDSVWYNGEQACNVSLAGDGSKRTLFLDFGSKTGKEFVGKSYGVHERLLIADSTGKLVKSVAAPNGYSFDHSEWVLGGFVKARSENQNFVVATLSNANGAHQKIVLVNLLDSSITELLEGTEVWHPCLQVPANSIITDAGALSLSADSAGVYYESSDNPLLSTKMNVFWAKNNYVKVIGVGSSRMSMGFVANKITCGAALNMASVPSDMNVSQYLIVNYLLNHAPQLKAIVLGLDLDLWLERRGVNIGKVILDIPGYHYDSNHDFWIKEGTESLKRLSLMMIRQSTKLSSMMESSGWVEYKEHVSWNQGHYGVPALASDSTWSNDSTRVNEALEDLEDIIKRSAKRNVAVLGVVFPQSPYYKKTGSFGRHGMRRSHAEKVFERLGKFEDEYSNFSILDENRMGDHDYPDSLAYDYDHLNSDGGYKITARIDSALAKMLKE